MNCFLSNQSESQSPCNWDWTLALLVWNQLRSLALNSVTHVTCDLTALRNTAQILAKHKYCRSYFLNLLLQEPFEATAIKDIHSAIWIMIWFCCTSLRMEAVLMFSNSMISSRSVHLSTKKTKGLNPEREKIKIFLKDIKMEKADKLPKFRQSKITAT